MSLDRRAGTWIAIAALALAAGACGRPPRPGAGIEAMGRAYAVARDHREALLRALTADLVVRIDGRATGRLPGVQATIALAAPDRVRLRATAIVGVGLDVLVRRDSVWAWLPSQRAMFAAPSESLGVREPAEFAGRVLGATWNPPERAWREAVRDSEGWALAWRDGADSLALVVDTQALPVRAWLGRGAQGLRVRYEAWERVKGEPFPARCRLEDDTGWARVRLDCESPQAESRADDGWFAPRRMRAERTLGLDDLRALFTRETSP